jgi:ribosomal protein S18 acetylase RimI-like enzyme
MKAVRAGLEHLENVARLFDAYRQFHGQASDVQAARRFLADRIRKAQSVIFLAVEGSSAVGFVQLYPCFSSVKMKPIWVLNDLFVAKEARRAGVARLLMNAASDMARSTATARLVLATAKDNTAAKAL